MKRKLVAVRGFLHDVRAVKHALFILGLVGCSVDAPPAPTPPAVTPFDSQGHRGARGLHPENTAEGMAEALAIGVATLEMDVGVTSDGVVVLHHDERLNPDIARDESGEWVSEPTPAIHALSLSELAVYDVGRIRPGSAYAERFPEQQGLDGVRIPTLAAVIELAEARSGGAIRYNIETKLSESAPDQTPPPEEFAEAVLAVVQQAGVTERVVIQSFDWRTLRHLASIAPDVQTSCLTFGSGDLDEMAEAGCSIWSPRFQSLDEMEVEAAHGAGMTVAVWTVNEPQEIEAALSLGVDAIISDYPDRVRTALEASSLSLPPAFPPAM